MKKVIHTHNYTKLAGGQHEENGKRTRGGEEGEREMDERRRGKEELKS